MKHSPTPSHSCSSSPATTHAPAAAPALSKPSSPASPSQPPYVPCSISAKQWDTVAIWSWDIQTKACAICKGNLADKCISCQAKGPSPATGAATASSSTTSSAPSPPRSGRTVTAAQPAPTTAPASSTSLKHTVSATLADLRDKCCIAWGTCGHVFHYHCVSRWLQMRSMCPVCGQPWQLHKITSND